MRVLLGKDPGCLPAAHLPLYRLDDGVELAASMPDFNERGLVPSGSPDYPVVLSSDEDSVEGEEEEEDSEATKEGMGEFSPQRLSELLRGLPDDNDAEEGLL